MIVGSKEKYMFTSESVTEGHPDKVADRISDAILDELIKQDPESKIPPATDISEGKIRNFCGRKQTRQQT